MLNPMDFKEIVHGTDTQRTGSLRIKARVQVNGVPIGGIPQLRGTFRLGVSFSLLKQVSLLVLRGSRHNV